MKSKIFRADFLSLWLAHLSVQTDVVTLPGTPLNGAVAKDVFSGNVFNKPLSFVVETCRNEKCLEKII